MLGRALALLPATSGHNQPFDVEFVCGDELTDHRLLVVGICPEVGRVNDAVPRSHRHWVVAAAGACVVSAGAHLVTTGACVVSAGARVPAARCRAAPGIL